MTIGGSRLRRVGRAIVSGLVHSGLVLAVSWPFVVSFMEQAPAEPIEGTRSCGSVRGAEHQRAIETARANVAAMARERSVPAISAAVRVGGSLVWSEAFGLADVDSGSPACPETLFRCASVSKVITAAAVARLVQQGRLDVDAPIQRYVPSFPEKAGSITLRRLAAHRAGIRPYRDDREAISLVDYPTVSESLAPFRDDPLVAAPGSAFVYSNYGYVLLSAAVETAAGTDFLSCLRREVFAPLGMTLTREDRFGAAAARLATSYDDTTPYSLDGRRVTSPPNNYSGRWASGGLLSTAEDLATLGDAHIARETGDPFLSAESVRMLTRPLSGLPPIAGYGMGWISARDLHARRVYFHFGAGSGATSVLAVWPREQVVLALMANLGHARFPFQRLMSTANPFLPATSPDRLASAGASCALIFALLRRRQRKANAPAAASCS